MAFLRRNSSDELEFFFAMGYEVRSKDGFRVMNGPHFIDSDTGPYIIIYDGSKMGSSKSNIRFLGFNLG